MKRGYSKLLYSQRNKNETIVSVIKRLFGEHITSRLVKTQNRELSFRCIAYNIHRLTNLIIYSMVSTEPFNTNDFFADAKALEKIRRTTGMELVQMSTHNGHTQLWFGRYMLQKDI